MHLLPTHFFLHTYHHLLRRSPVTGKGMTHVTGLSFRSGHGNRSNLPPAEFALSVLSSNHANTVITHRPTFSDVQLRRSRSIASRVQRLCPTWRRSASSCFPLLLSFCDTLSLSHCWWSGVAWEIVPSYNVARDSTREIHSAGPILQQDNHHQIRSGPLYIQ